MTKFLTFFPIGPISNNDEYLGLSPDSASGVVINTLNQNIVYRIELGTQKTIKSWNSDRKLSHKVIYDYKSQKYVGVFGNVYMRVWGEDDEHFFQSKKIKNDNGKIKLTKSLEAMISFDGKYTILVYKDGTCQSLENFLERRISDCTPIIKEDNHQILNIACFTTLNKNVMMTYFLRNKQTGTMEFVYFLLDDDTLSTTGNIHRIKLTRSESTLSAFTVVEGKMFPSLMTIWSDKRIFMLPIRCDEHTPSDFGPLVSMFDCLRVDQSLSIVNVSKNCIAMYGANNQQDGASLVLYNTLYHVVQCKQFFKAHLDNCRLWVIGKYVLIAVGQQLSCVQFQISQERLADIIGSKRSVDFSGSVIKDSLNEESELEECVLFDQEAQLLKNSINVQTNSNSLRKTIRLEIQNQHNQPNEPYDEFIDKLRSLYVHNIPIDIVRGDSLVSELIQTITVVDTKDQLYSIEAINLLTGVLENRGSSESEITEHIIPLLIEAKLPKELAICIRKYTNISEQMLARSLKFFIGNKDSSTSNLTYINDVLACSFNATLIKEHLRTLNLEEAIYLLEHIHTELLANDSLLNGTELQWFVVIIDSHFQQFMLARDQKLRDKIIKWKTSVDTFISNIRDWTSVAAKLHSIVAGKAKPNDNPSSKFYSVEVVKLY